MGRIVASPGPLGRSLRVGAPNFAGAGSLPLNQFGLAGGIAGFLAGSRFGLRYATVTTLRPPVTTSQYQRPLPLGMMRNSMLVSRPALLMVHLPINIYVIDQTAFRSAATTTKEGY